MVHELRKRGYQVQQQALIEVQYDGQVVGQYFADLLIEGKVIVENKAADSIHESHEAQLVNYLKASHVEVGLLFNFGPKAEYRRKVFTNRSKQSHHR
jgi:GxxExxY protein